MGFAAGPLTTTQPAPTLLTMTFEMYSRDYRADLCLQSNNGDDIIITIVHEKAVEAIVYDMIGQAEGITIPGVADRESLTVLVRGCEGILACAVYEVDLGQAEKIGIVLVPRCVSNIVLDQNEFVAAPYSTQPLIQTSEQASPATSARIAAIDFQGVL